MCKLLLISYLHNLCSLSFSFAVTIHDPEAYRNQHHLCSERSYFVSQRDAFNIISACRKCVQVKQNPYVTSGEFCISQ